MKCEALKVNLLSSTLVFRRVNCWILTVALFDDFHFVSGCCSVALGRGWRFVIRQRQRRRSLNFLHERKILGVFDLRRVNSNNFRLGLWRIAESRGRHTAAGALLHLRKLRENCHAVENIAHRYLKLLNLKAIAWMGGVTWLFHDLTWLVSMEQVFVKSCTISCPPRLAAGPLSPEISGMVCMFDTFFHSALIACLQKRSFTIWNGL